MQEQLLELKHLYEQKFIGSCYTNEFKRFTLDIKRDLPKSMESLKKTVLSCNICELSKTRKNVVFGEGDIDAKLMLIGEAPGANEDEQGRPFVGRAGMLLERIINSVLDMQRSEVYIANILKCRPPNNRVPTPSEAQTCLPYLKRQIEIVKPLIIVALGATAYHYLTGDKSEISKVRGEILVYGDAKLIPTFHPSYLLRNPSAKKEAYEDFKKVRSLL